MRTVTAEEMKRCDSFTIEEIGVPSLVLMEHAALAIVEEILSGGYPLKNILVLCGMGNNGGDGLAIARLLFLKGYSVDLCLIGNPEHTTNETRQQLKICDFYKIPIIESNELAASVRKYSLIVDSVLGIGLKKAVYPEIQQLFSIINDSPAKVIAVDLPSGLSADTGEILGSAIKADTTVTFQFSKKGLATKNGKELAGKLIVADIGISALPLQ